MEAALDARLSAHLSAIAGPTLDSSLLATDEGNAELPLWAQAFAHLALGLQSPGRRVRDSDYRRALEALGAPLVGQIARLAAGNIALTEERLRGLRRIINDPRFVDVTPAGGSSSDRKSLPICTRLDAKPFLGLRMLWVDDRPGNNERVSAGLWKTRWRRAWNIQRASTTKKALAHPSLKNADIILSDMSRSGNCDAGYDLLRELKKIGIVTPVIIYADYAMSTAEDRARVVAAGAFGSTNSVAELIELIDQAGPYNVFQYMYLPGTHSCSRYGRRSLEFCAPALRYFGPRPVWRSRRSEGPTQLCHAFR